MQGESWVGGWGKVGLGWECGGRGLYECNQMGVGMRGGGGGLHECNQMGVGMREGGGGFMSAIRWGWECGVRVGGKGEGTA